MTNGAMLDIGTSDVNVYEDDDGVDAGANQVQDAS
jgi:hypothetical protein